MALINLDLALAVYFTVYFFARLWLAENRGKFLVSWGTLVDALTVVPVFATYAMLARHKVDVPVLMTLSILRILRVLRLFNMTKVGTGAIRGGGRGVRSRVGEGTRGRAWRSTQAQLQRGAPQPQVTTRAPHPGPPCPVRSHPPNRQRSVLRTQSRAR